MEPAELIETLRDLESAEQARRVRVRDRFEAQSGHKRGIVLLGADATLWRQLETADPPDHAAADQLAALAINSYLVADDGGRRMLRSFFVGAGYLSWRLGWPAAAAIDAISTATPGNAAEPIRRALAGAVLFAIRSDPRDLSLMLDHLLLATLRAGVDPTSLIREALVELPPAPGTAAIHRLLRESLEPERAAALRRAAGSSPSTTATATGLPVDRET